jgi:hypothetical protein
MLRKMSGFRLTEMIAPQLSYVVAGARHHPERLGHVADDERRNSPICARPTCNGERGFQGMPGENHDQDRGKRLDQKDDRASRRSMSAGVVEQVR